MPVTFSKTFSPIFLRVSKYCCTFEGEYRKEEFLPEETKVEGWRKFLLAIIFGIMDLAVAYLGGAILLVVLLFVPGALMVILKSFLKYGKDISKMI